MFAMHEPTQVGAARRHAATLADRHGFDEVAAGRLALVVTELGTNLVRHARDGRLLIAAAQDDPAAHVEVVSLDRGPGMADIERCLRDGFSSGGTPGSGLGAVRRLSASFDAFSCPEQGTVIVARVARDSRAAPAHAAGAGAEPLDIAGIATAAPGEHVCGDGWRGTQAAGAGRLIVADGLGHGPEAAKASDAALAVLGTHADDGLAQLLSRTHGNLQGTRGAAVAFVAFDAAQSEIIFCGAGNIVGRVISGTDDRSFMSQHGTVGLQVQRPHIVRQAWPAHAVLVVHSDGVATRWNLKDVPGLLGCPAAVIAAWILNLHARGRDDATVVVVRRP